MGDLGQIVPVRWDIRDRDSIKNACQYSNVIINLTGARWDTRNFTLHDVHVAGAKRIAEVAKELKVDRFIHVSAVGADVNASSDWLKTKAEGELAVRSVFPEATIVRPATLWGAQDRFLNSIGMMIKYWPVYLLLHADTQLQPVYVNNVANAIVNIVKSDNTLGKTYELGGPHILTNRQLVDWISALLKFDKKIIEVKDENLQWHLGYWSGQLRNPRFTLDSIKQSEDIVCSGKFPGFSDLGIIPISVTSPTGRGSILYLRKPSRMLDIVADLSEIPETELPGRPAHGHTKNPNLNLPQ
jgi:uncharacterized protein YbjT (DUF2867 family)